MKRLTAFLCLLLCAGGAGAEVIEQDIKLPGGAGNGVLFMDDDLDRMTAGVIVVHEWWGLNDYARNRARLLAKEGYVALAVNLYEQGQVASHPKDAKTFMAQAQANPERTTARINAAKTLLRQQQYVDDDRVFAVGYCFGGGVVLEQARQGNDLAGVASFHGPLGTEQPLQSGTFQGKVLVATGQADPMVPAEQVSALVQEMTAAGVEFQLLSFPGAQHGFTNPRADQLGQRFEMPLAYDGHADDISWGALKDFIDTP
ncbi:dienelactone hydrolase family protein [Alcanivorax marinus]|uniref:Dienelactone hydrolase family protein n=1 Tax=Alloalcanivorax marinus TaxID=1177169 RepID=A0A9Q3UHL3_9GAMM|nr:dienelactone hydrolase family protein [Alloalcanivorax marinus]MCC4307326.1 dienelactone hydrolase family protein [Alloalcanivorax marinus]MCH2558223.1 dienelactone hydrolase family protein [Alcanivorax sp.]